MLGVYICEDEKKHLDKITENVKETIMIEEMDMRIVLATGNPYEILDILEENRSINVYILDVDLKSDINGLDLAVKIRKLDPRGYIIFVTTHAEMSYMTFQYKVEAFDFIIKDGGMYQKQIRETLCLVYERHFSSALQKNVFSIRQNGTIITEEYDQIYLFEVSETPHMLYMIAKERQVKFTSTLKGVEDSLDDRFFRCSSSSLINLDKVVRFDKKLRVLELENGDECVVSTRMMKDLLKKFIK